MSAPSQLSDVNRLIVSLPRTERNKILRCCEPIELAYGDVLCEPWKIAKHVYFPLNCIISLVATVSGHSPLQMRMIGSEGMLGVTLALGVHTAPLGAAVLVAGAALRIEVLQFRRELRHTSNLLRALHRYLYVLWGQLSQTVACNHFHVVGQRLATCLLMTHDRVHADHFHITHELLADMLGVRRSGITHAAGALQICRLIRYSRGEITILDRRGLEAASCECYRMAKETYAEQFGG